MAAKDKQAIRNIGWAVAGIGLLVVVLYFAWTWLAGSKTEQTPDSNVRASYGRTERQTEQSPYYTQLLRDHNVDGSEQAMGSGNSFLSTPDSEASTSIEENDGEQAEAEPEEPVNYYPPPQQTQVNQGEEQHEVDPALQRHVQGLLTIWSASDASSELAQVTTWERSSDGQEQTQGSGNRASGENRENTGNRNESYVNTIIVPGFYRTPATLKTALDTDENSLVRADITTGPYSGAKVYATGYRRLENTVDMTFTAMKWRGNTFQINAKPVDINTSRTALNGDVDHHLFSRIILPAIARGIGNAGDLYKESSQTQVVTPLGGTVSSRDGVDTNEVIGSVVGGAANQTANVLEQDASRIPIKTVHIPQEQTIGIQFIDAVTTADMLNPDAKPMNIESLSQPSQQPDQRQQSFQPSGNQQRQQGFGNAYGQGSY